MTSDWTPALFFYTFREEVPSTPRSNIEPPQASLAPPLSLPATPQVPQPTTPPVLRLISIVNQLDALAVRQRQQFMQLFQEVDERHHQLRQEFLSVIQEQHLHSKVDSNSV